jgi:hypothetical protein
MPEAEGELTAVPAHELIEVLYSIDEELEGLRNAVDRLRERVQCALRNVLGHEHGRTVLTSMPRDPCGETFSTRINAVPAEQVDAIRREAIANTCTAPGPDSTGIDPASNDRVESASTIAQEAGDAHALPANMNRSGQTLPDAASERGTAKRQPLSLRIYFQPVMTDIVRAIGYEVLACNEALLRLEPLAKRYGQPVVEEAARELLVWAEDHSDHWRLSSEASRLSRALLGPPPESAGETGAAVSAAALRNSREVACNGDEQPSTPAREVNAARKTVLSRFREHLATTDEEACDVPADDLHKFRERGWMLPDLMIVDEFIAVRRRLPAAQRAEMQQWLEASASGIQATRVWPQETAAGWEWIYEVVASQHD